MCLIILAWKARADLPLAVAANRDEWRDRPTQAAHWWPDHPELLAGRDLEAGGTWMGITRGGRFAAVTNFRDPSERRATARSRGTLVSEFLLGGETPRDYLARLAPSAGEYNGFNLILGDGTTLCYYSSREDKAREIEPGVHGLSNNLLNEPWPKVVKGRAKMHEALRDEDPAPRLFELLSDRSFVDDTHLPRTGVGIDWERRLATALITGADYGTRSSTVLTVDAKGAARFQEHVLGPKGELLQATVNGEAVRSGAGATTA
ncbi:MAG TPA: NRDE family protein [Usitatibacter sp.]|nr:NRDE family protein [Usitatibacter sp.]